MADIRIKDLSSASSSASDDFIAIDGTTNGTRKLSAYSPSFGGNATVGGTLSITGQANFAGGTTFKWATDGDVYGRQFFSGANGTDGVKITQASGTGIIASIGNGGLSFRDDANTQLMNLADSTGVVSIPSTSASTSTSSGALVVSGGVGVGGAVVAGGTLTVNGTGTSKVGGILRVGDVSTGLYLAEDTGGNAYVATGVGTAATGFLVGTSSNIPLRFQINSSIVARFAPTTGNLLIGTETDISGSGGLKVAGTTASTSTSSGALVVSGGVGVAGAIYAGGYTSTASHARIGASGSVVALSAANNVDSGLPAAWNGNYGLGVYYSAASTNTILIGDGSAGTTIFATRTASANTSRITIDNTNGNTTFAGTIAIGNTVNSVSPTSPNRTITMVIGGTTYYIHAKTTND